MARTRGGHETRVLTTVKWIFFTLGAVALVLFLLDPDLRAHPQLVLLAGTGLLGTLTLHGLSGILRPAKD